MSGIPAVIVSLLDEVDMRTEIYGAACLSDWETAGEESQVPMLDGWRDCELSGNFLQVCFNVNNLTHS